MKNIKKIIQEKIGYTFNNQQLLKQAFTRKTYSEENGGENNECLEFVGDKALDTVVIIALLKRFSKTNEDGSFHTDYNEGQFTDIKRDLVEKKALSKSMDKLGFNQYLLMGKGDIAQNIQEQASVKEDLFEAIIGAVAIDSNWNYDALYKVADNMINFDEYFSTKELNDFNYIGWVNNYVQQTTMFPPVVTNEWNEELKKFVCAVIVPLNGENKLFRGLGDSKKKSAYEAAKQAYEEIQTNMPKTNPILEFIGEPNLQDSISQVNMLVSKKVITLPKEGEQHSYNKDGVDLWNMFLYADGKTYANMSVGKKNDARRQNYYEYLIDLIDKYNK